MGRRWRRTSGSILREPHGTESLRAIVLHELGHIVGLAHVDDPHELMYGDNIGMTDFGPGDLTGLARLGQGACAPGV